MLLVIFFCLCFRKLWLQINVYDKKHYPQLIKFRANSIRNDKELNLFFKLLS